jgi:hypothetical protein
MIHTQALKELGNYVKNSELGKKSGDPSLPKPFVDLVNGAKDQRDLDTILNELRRECNDLTHSFQNVYEKDGMCYPCL